MPSQKRPSVGTTDSTVSTTTTRATSKSQVKLSAAGQAAAMVVLDHDDKQPTLTSYIGSKKPYDPNSLRAKQINRSLAEFITLDMGPLCLIEGKGFRGFSNTLDPRYKVIARGTLLENWIVPLYQVTKAVVKHQIGHSLSQAFTKDAWTSANMYSYTTTTLHFFEPSTFELKSVVLDTHHTTGSHTAAKLATYLKITEITWDLMEVKGVSDNASNIQNALQLYGSPHFGFFAHTLNLAVGKALEEKQLHKTIARVHNLVTTFKTSYLKTEALHENQKLQAIDKLQLKQDVCTRWNSAYYMIERVLAVYPATVYRVNIAHIK